MDRDKIIEFQSNFQAANMFIHMNNLMALVSQSKKVQVFHMALYAVGRAPRRMGNTTRVVDLAIQFLFLYGELRIEWIRLDEENWQMAEHTWAMIRRRLANEHASKSCPIFMNSKQIVVIIKPNPLETECSTKTTTIQ